MQRAAITMAMMLATALGTAVVSTAAARMHGDVSARWSPAERETLRSLTLASLGPLPRDPSNRYADDAGAASLGRALFFDTRLSGNGKVSCATCHIPTAQFQDSRALGSGVGTTARRTMPIASTARSPWLFWDGRADSQWAQALGPLESPVEHGGTRAQYAQVIARHYGAQYDSVFGAPTDDVARVYADIGKAIAAYERRIEYGPSRFDRYVDAELSGRAHTPLDSFSPDEERGLRIFIGKGSCTNCHNGALLTDDHFHNTGVAASPLVAAADSGRATGVRKALAGEFNCTSKYSDAKPDECDELRFAVTEGAELVRAYKPPSLRNVADRAPYMHAGQLATLEDVVAHYSAAPAAPFGHSELKPLGLTRAEQGQVIAFLRTLSGSIVAPPGFLDPPAQR
jgi:cytochrome c peroxidase